MGLIANMRVGLQRILGRSDGESEVCSHLDTIRDIDVANAERACLQCVELGDDWVHLRICMICGAVGCCDSSPNMHAHKHAESTDHRIAASLEPGENWIWCYADEVGFEIGA